MNSLKKYKNSIIKCNGLVRYVVDEPRYNAKKGTYNLRFCYCDLVSGDCSDKFSFSHNGYNYVVNFSNIYDLDISSEEYDQIEKIGEATSEFKNYISNLKKVVKKYYNKLDFLNALLSFIAILPFAIAGQFYSVLSIIIFYAINKFYNFSFEKYKTKKKNMFTKLINNDFDSFGKLDKKSINRIIKRLKEKYKIEILECPATDRMFTMVDQEQGSLAGETTQELSDTSSDNKSNQQQKIDPVVNGFSGRGPLAKENKNLKHD